jgi:subtilase family serine protease
MNGPIVVGTAVRRAGFLVALMCLLCAIRATAANALPGLGQKPRGPVSGPHVDAGCANPANRGRAGRTLGGVQASVGGQLRCFSQAIAHGPGLGPQMMPGPVGLSPSQIRAAYSLGGLSAAGRIVAVVDAFDDPNAESDLATFRSAYGLPACTSANGCFSKLNQNGASSPLPSGDPGWGVEISLDLDAVSAACPDCHILLVEGNSAFTSDLLTADQTAEGVSGVASLSDSWGGGEVSGITSLDHFVNHPGIAITASSGDSGFGVQWPASSPFVSGVGGTTLTAASTKRGWSESVWSGAGSGCSAFEPKPAWQHDSGCANRTVADVSAVADPNTGIGVYDTYNNCASPGSSACDTQIEQRLAQGLDGWAQVGGTSLASPLIASVYALAGNTGSIDYGSFPYAHTGSLYDVTSGSNGSCSPAYLCSGGPGYDGPSGLGTPNGDQAF